MVLLGEPAFPGCAVTARPVGVFWLTDEKGPDAKVLAVPARDPRYAGLRDLSDVPVLMYSGTSPAPDELERLRPGRDAFKPKPFFGSELADTVDALLAA